MINLDPYINEFISGNWLALSLFMALLKAIAILTPTVKDNKIHALLTEVFSLIRRK